jgi:HAE1 family hydrophobic/amphiphilic exporter-1
MTHGHTGLLARIGGAACAHFYRSTLSACLGAPFIVFVVALLFTAAGATSFFTIKSELTPSEDRSMVMLRVNAPQGVSLEYAQDQMKLIENKLRPLYEDGEIINIFSISGQGGSTNSGFMVLTLAPLGRARAHAAGRSCRTSTRAVGSVPSVRAFAMQPNSLGIRGAGNGLQVALVGNDYTKLGNAAAELVRKIEDSGRFQNVRLNYEANQAQLSVTVDRESAPPTSALTSPAFRPRCRPCSKARASSTSMSRGRPIRSSSPRRRSRSTTRWISRTSS